MLILPFKIEIKLFNPPFKILIIEIIQSHNPNLHTKHMLGFISILHCKIIDRNNMWS